MTSQIKQVLSEPPGAVSKPVCISDVHIKYSIAFMPANLLNPVSILTGLVSGCYKSSAQAVRGKLICSK